MSSNNNFINSPSINSPISNISSSNSQLSNIDGIENISNIDDISNISNIASYNYKHKFNNESLDILIKTVEILNGKIYGEFVSLYFIPKKILNKDYTSFENINVIFNDVNDRTVFIRLLRNVFEIYTNGNDSSYMILFKIPNDQYTYIVNLNIYIKTNYIDLKNHTNYIDINLLSISGDGVNLINYLNSENNIQKYSLIFNRIMNKKFSLISYYYDSILECFDKAYYLIQNNWIMDDYYLEKEMSVLFYWKNRNIIRTTYNENENKKLVEGNVCSICSNEFNNNDIVVNTKCNHNFHWCCGAENNLGIKYWILNYSHKCPMCRCEYCV